MTIGKLARAAGAHVETIRYYQRCGLMPVPGRAEGRVRRYPEEAIDRLRFIRRAQELGFSLADVKQLLRLERSPGCRDARALAAEKLAAIEGRVADLAQMAASLRGLIAQCDARAGRACPIIEALRPAGGG
jgi:MerR family mercuric resistance operon transcriptional regulator